MTHTPDTTHTRGKRVSTPTTAQHPLDPFTANEIATVRDVLTAAGLMTEHVRMAMLLPVDILVNHLPIHTLNDAETHKICHGQPVHVAEKDAIIQGCRLYDSQQRFVGIGRMRADGLLWPDRLLAFSPAA